MRRNWHVVAALSIALIFPGSVAAHFNTGFYSHKQDNCSSRIDPITVVYYDYANADRTNNHIRNHFGWGGGTGGGQYFASHGICGAGTRHAESGCGFCTRFHIRMRKTYNGDSLWGTTTVGTPHHEDWVSTCNSGLGGHAVDKGGVDKGEGLRSGFDQGRDKMSSMGGSGHYLGGSSNWGNTQEFKQCDGDWAGSHGTVYWIHIPNNYH